MANHCFHANLATGPKLNLLKFFSLDQNQIRGQNLVMKVLAFSEFNFSVHTLVCSDKCVGELERIRGNNLKTRLKTSVSKLIVMFPS